MGIDEERAPARRNADVHLASLDAKMDSVMASLQAKTELLQQQIGFTDRNSAQLVKLIEEKLLGLTAKVGDIQRTQEKDRDSFLGSIAAIDDRVQKLELFKTKLVGIAFGISLTSGGIVGAIVKLTSG